MIYIYDTIDEVFEKWSIGKSFLILPENSVFKFMVNNLDKFSLLRADKKIINTVNKKKNLSVKALENVFKEKEYFDIYTKNNREQAEELFQKISKDISEGKDVHTDLTAFSLFFEWSKLNNVSLDTNVYYPYENENIKISYAKTKLKPITLNNLDKILKLFCLFYGKEIASRDIYLIGSFQKKLVSFDKTIFEELDDIICIIEKLYKKYKEQMPLNNIFNKVLEMLELLKRLEKGYEVQSEVKLNVLVPKKDLLREYEEKFEKLLED